jgi:Nuclease A inhibitor-like protein.
MKHKSSDAGASLTDQIGKAVKGLNYISETDSAIEVFSDPSMREPTVDELMTAIGNPDDTFAETRDIGSFFDRLATVKEWHTADQRKTVRRFKKLRQLMEREMEDLRVIRIGRIRIEIYVIGRTGSGDVAGIRTAAVET